MDLQAFAHRLHGVAPELQPIAKNLHFMKIDLQGVEMKLQRMPRELQRMARELQGFEPWSPHVAGTMQPMGARLHRVERMANCFGVR